MNSSAENDPPILVCTNTWKDYALTRRDPMFDDETAGRFLKVLLPAFARVVTQCRGEFQTAVGVMALPNDPRRIVAFRVFDVGEFRGRPNTLGIVGIAVPRSRDRAEPLSAFLARLPPPQPDTEQYSLNERGAGATLANALPAVATPFFRLDEWERTGGEPSHDGPVVFCHPESCTPQIRWTPKEASSNDRRKSRRWKRTICAVGGLLALAAGIAFWIGWGPGDRPPRRVFQQSSFEASRERAARLLCESRWITEFEATTSATPHLVAQTPLAAGHARQNMERLSAVLDSMPSGNSADVSEALAAHLKLWEAPPSAEVAAILPVNTETLERSLKIVEAYAALFADLNETVQNPTPRNIDRLRAGVKNGLALPPP